MICSCCKSEFGTGKVCSFCGNVPNASVKFRAKALKASSTDNFGLGFCGMTAQAVFARESGSGGWMSLEPGELALNKDSLKHYVARKRVDNPHFLAGADLDRMAVGN